MKLRLLVCLLALGLALPALAGLPQSAEKRTLVRLEGWIVDSYCGAKNANAEAAEDTLACVKKGATLLFVDKEGTTYDIEDQERALEHVGQLIRIFGTVDEERNLKIGNYIGSDKDGKTKKPMQKPAKKKGLGLKSGKP